MLVAKAVPNEIIAAQVDEMSNEVFRPILSKIEKIITRGENH